MAKTQKQARRSRAKARELAQKKNDALVYAAGLKTRERVVVREQIHTTMKKTWSEMMAKKTKKPGFFSRMWKRLIGSR